jgi:hypothetical protein
MKKLSIIGIFGGAILIISSWARYFVLYPDFDKAIIYGIVGFLVVAISYLWDVRCKDVKETEKLSNTLLEVEEFLASKKLEDKDE